jgi:hypothetical protein
MAPKKQICFGHALTDNATILTHENDVLSHDHDGVFNLNYPHDRTGSLYFLNGENILYNQTKYVFYQSSNQLSHFERRLFPFFLALTLRH